MVEKRLSEALISSPLQTFQSLQIPQSRPSTEPLAPLSLFIRPDFTISLSTNLSVAGIGDMAQKTENEDTEFKVPEPLTLCVNKCGVVGNPATNNMCQKCFTATTTTATSSSLPAPSIMKFSAAKSSRSISSNFPERLNPASEAGRDVSLVCNDLVGVPAKKMVNRCSGCRKRVGLTGFRCRCGELFCSEHRYSDRHMCSYDYKTAGREAIARENPVVKAAKIVRV